MNPLATMTPLLAILEEFGSPLGSGIFGLIHLILFILALYYIWTGGGTGGHKILWTLLVIFLPCIGVALYFLIGRGRV